jgi:hypothetical protein
LKRLAEFVDDLVFKTGYALDQSLVFTDTLPKGEQKGQVFQKGFAIKEFERINKCAYFDYQRDMISARLGIRTHGAGKGIKRRRWKLRLNKTVHVALKKCPSCRSRQVRARRAIARTIIDLNSQFGV